MDIVRLQAEMAGGDVKPRCLPAASRRGSRETDVARRGHEERGHIVISSTPIRLWHLKLWWWELRWWEFPWLWIAWTIWAIWIIPWPWCKCALHFLCHKHQTFPCRRHHHHRQSHHQSPVLVPFRPKRRPWHKQQQWQGSNNKNQRLIWMIYDVHGSRRWYIFLVSAPPSKSMMLTFAPACELQSCDCWMCNAAFYFVNQFHVWVSFFWKVEKSLVGYHWPVKGEASFNRNSSLYPSGCNR